MLTKYIFEGCLWCNLLGLGLIVATATAMWLWWRQRQVITDQTTAFDAAQAAELREQKSNLEQQIFTLENMLNLMRRRARNLLAYAPITITDDNASGNENSSSSQIISSPHRDTALLPNLATMLGGEVTNKEDPERETVNLLAFSEKVNKIFTALAENLAWYKSVVAGLKLPTLIIDLQKNVKYANPQFCELRGKTFTEMHNQNCEKFAFADCCSNDCCVECFHRNAPLIPVYEAYCKKWLKSHVSALTDASGKQIGYIIQLEELTENAAQAELMTMRSA